ncbi:hypothetical protein JXJ21_14195 [candidate division KSB1 bacterium]|nr:hypothetical protein [candidate division KSB1 bacterium]
MTARERFLTALNNEKPDRLPCQVHSWMSYYLNSYLGGIDQYAAYERFGMDMVIYQSPKYNYSDRTLANWRTSRKTLTDDGKGNSTWITTTETPRGRLTSRSESNPFTTWDTEHLIKSEADFELWREFVPLPESVDWKPVVDAKNRIGECGIVRSGFFDFGQGSPWQSLCILMGTQQTIMAAMDTPDWVHFALKSMLEKKLAVIERAGKCELDLIETGGGAASSTVISPKLFKEFCLPYDRQQHRALHAFGGRVVYHLCGGLMPMLGLVVENEADGLETMTPVSMGGDCILSQATQRVGDKLFFIGGFDQNAGFEKGTPDVVRKLVFECHAACPDGGYICCASDHFFFGDPRNIQAFVDAAKECVY